MREPGADDSDFAWLRDPFAAHPEQPKTRPRVSSPGGWFAPDDAKAGWNWLPPGGDATPFESAMPIWLRIWARIPLLNRFANVWIWRHGYFLVYPPSVPPEAGVREPRRPRAPASAGAIALELELDQEEDIQP